MASTLLRKEKQLLLRDDLELILYSPLIDRAPTSEILTSLVLTKEKNYDAISP